MRFLFIAGNGHDARILRNLGSGLCSFGHDVHLSSKDRMTGWFDGADVVLDVNHSRDEAIPEDIRHIAWVQDYFHDDPPDYDDCLPDDIIYCFGDPRILGAPLWKHYRGSLTPGVNEVLLDRPPVELDLDFSIAGYVPDPWTMTASTQIAGKAFSTMHIMDEVVRRYYKPLRGEFDSRAMMAKVRDKLERFLTIEGYGHQIEYAWAQIKRNIAYGVHEMSRDADRKAAARLALSVSDDTELWGFGWDKWLEFAKWARPFTDNHERILNLHQLSRINVHNNIYGFALHTRVLESMAVGGFVMANRSPYLGMAGQMTECFEPGTHYGEYDDRHYRICEQ